MEERKNNDDNQGEIMLFDFSNSNEEYVYNFLKNKMCLNTAAISAIIDNLASENSAFNPNRRQGGGEGFGTYDDGVGYGIC